MAEPDRIVAARSFSIADQRMFAAASGDRNPIHMDPIAARRTPAGAPVAHGMHVFLWALEHLLPASQPGSELIAATAQFRRFVYLDQPVALEVVARTVQSVKAEVRADGLPTTKLTLQFGNRTSGRAPELPESLPELQIPDTPASPEFDSMARLGGSLALPHATGELAGLLPGAVAAIEWQRVAALARTSAIVGMICPGLHSILSELRVKLVEAGSARSGISFKTTRTDDRFRLVTMAVAGAGLAGEVGCFVRREPVAPPDRQAYASLVKRGEFASVTALVVGGSRGLGAATAKLIAAGGGRVVITYATGHDDARALVQDIEAEHGAGSCSAIALDVNHEIGPQLEGRLPDIDQLYYFATPHIYRPRGTLYTQQAFEEFIRFYVLRFYETARLIGSGSSSRRLSIFYPSSVFVDRTPPHLTEYAMAKSAGELLCKALASAEPRWRVVSERLPVVRTDQTASVIPADDADAVDIMLPLIRALI